jgi:gas vesicle protein
MEKKSDNSNTIKLVIAGASAAALAATAYFLFGPNGKKNQKHIKAWAIKMKAEVIEKLEQAKEISKPIYQEIIDSVAADYKNSKKAGQEEIDDLAEDLKKHWQSISKIAITGKKELSKKTSKLTTKTKK